MGKKGGNISKFELTLVREDQETETPRTTLPEGGSVDTWLRHAVCWGVGVGGAGEDGGRGAGAAGAKRPPAKTHNKTKTGEN